VTGAAILSALPGTAPIVFGASCDNAATVTLVMKGTAWFSVGCSH